MAETPNYVLGRGKLYFDAFAAGTFLYQGERYLGNTPGLTMNSTYQNLDHYNSDEGLRIKDASVQLQLDRSGSLTCDNINIDNLAMMFGNGLQTAAQVSFTGAAEVITVQKGLYYQMGRTDDIPDGIRLITNLVLTDNSGDHASGTLTFTAQPDPADTVTINGQAITFVAGSPAANEVQIGANTTVTAQGLAALINAAPQTFRMASTGAAAVLTLTAIASGTGGNALTLAISGTYPAISAGTLLGGTASLVIVQNGNITVDLDRARVYVRDDAATILDDDEIEFVYDISAGSRYVVVDQNDVVEGGLRFIADNAIGDNRDYFWPRVRLTPTGEFALKGDTWQQMTMNFDVLQLRDLARVYVSDVPTS
jgi:hypothetical protein